jgi:hypothetical protein
VALTWRPEGSSDTPDRFNGCDDGQLRGWVWRISDHCWLGAVVTVGGSDRVAGERGDPQAAMALFDERYG